MSGTRLPDGQYVSLIGNLRLGKGGQTRALLMRNRLFARQGGVRPVIVTLDQHPDYDGIRTQLLASGELVDGVRLENIYDWHAEQDVAAPEGAPELAGLPETGDGRVLRRPDGSVYLRRHPHGDGLETVDLYRRDGTVVVRQEQYTEADRPLFSTQPYVAGAEPALPVTLVDRSGRVVRTWPSSGAFRRDWVRALVPGDDRVFVISDSRFVLPDLLGMEDRFHVVHLMHNPHVLKPWRWNSRFAHTYVRLMTMVGHLDGLVSLTERQREAVGQRLGARTNLFVVPNPVESPPLPADLPERPRDRFVVVARLDAKKQVEHAVRAFARVVAEEPAATLHIYGRGDQRDTVEAEVAAHRLQGSVTLHGFDPNARNATWSATAFLMTSTYEGYPLATLEAMSHGCPVISYDITYGPREQVTDGGDGFLVKPDDVDGLADRMLQLVRDPELVAKMSAAALVKAGEHDYEAFLEDWRRVLETVATDKSRRVSVESVDLTGLRQGSSLGTRINRIARRRLVPGAREGRTISGVVEVRGTTGPEGDADAIRLTLDAVSPRREVVLGVPLEVQRDGRRLTFTAAPSGARIAKVFKDARPSVTLRLRVVWENASWEAVLDEEGALVRRFEPSTVAAVRPVRRARKD